MFKPVDSFSGYSVDDPGKAKDFYTKTLGMELLGEEMGLRIGLPRGEVFLYEKDDHKPAEFTVLNFVVEDIDQSLEELSSRGIQFETYDLGSEAKQDEKGILRGLTYKMGPDIAWFKDPAGNVLSILQDS